MDAIDKGLLYGAISGVVILLVVSGGLFVYTGGWPPLYQVSGNSMHPALNDGEFVVAGTVSNESITTVSEASSMQSATILVFKPNAGEFKNNMIIHRAVTHTATGENWYKDVPHKWIPPWMDSCNETPYCPAPHSGYITKGDNNPFIDQTKLYAPPASMDMVRARVTAIIRIPTTITYAFISILLFSGSLYIFYSKVYTKQQDTNELDSAPDNTSNGKQRN